MRKKCEDTGKGEYKKILLVIFRKVLDFSDGMWYIVDRNFFGGKRNEQAKTGGNSASRFIASRALRDRNFGQGSVSVFGQIGGFGYENMAGTAFAAYELRRQSYQSCAAEALNYYFIDLDFLQKDGLLEKEEYAFLDWETDARRVDYEKLFRLRVNVLRCAFFEIRHFFGRVEKVP